MTRKNPKVVVIDDSPTSISLYELSAGPLAVDLSTFASPIDSLEYLEEHEADLVFLDILMREKDGLAVLKNMRAMELHQNTVVVMVTSKDYAQDRQTALEFGARDYLVKPLRSQEIREVICKYTDARFIDGESGAS